MAYDPEARRQSNSALTVGLVALGLVVAGAVGYTLMQPADSPAPTIIQSKRTEVIEKPVDRPVIVPQTQPDVVIVQPNNVQSRPAAPPTTTTTTNTVIRTERIPAAPAPAESAPSTTTNNTTVNVTSPTAAPAPAENTATEEPAPADSTSSTTNSSSE